MAAVRIARSFTLLLLIVIFAPALSAQIVRGVLVSDSRGEPLGGFIVVLLDSTARRQAGQYRLRAKRVGERAVTSAPFRLEAGQTLDYRLRIRQAPVTLAGVRVSADRRCAISSEVGLQTYRLWEEVRKAM